MLRRNQSAPRGEKNSAQNGDSKTRSVLHRNPSSSPTRPVLDVLDNQLEQLADELHKRRSRESSAHGQGQRSSRGQVEVKGQTAVTMIDPDDPAQMLNTWLGELDSLSKDLDAQKMTVSSSKSTVGKNQSYTLGRRPAHSPVKLNPPSSPTLSSRDPNNPTPVHLRRMSTPRVDSPRLDSYRYSLINLEETLEQDLDAILGELCALESNLGRSKSPNSTPVAHSEASTLQRRKDTPPISSDTPSELPPPPAPLQLEELLASEPQYITAESVRRNKSLLTAKRTESPDTDSAFCENGSSNSSSSSDKQQRQLVDQVDGDNLSRKSSSTLSGGNVLNNSFEVKVRPSIEDEAAKAKAEKIRLAIEKIKEASIKKIFIKVFGDDGSAKSLLVDERMSVNQVCSMLAEKHYVKRDTTWGLVELLPDLHMERAYEDHESLVENLLMWKADSKNTLWFIKRPEVYDLFNRPELYLLGDTSSQIGTEMEDRARAELIEEYFSSTGVGAPEVEGFLWLKAEGKKTWKRFYFVLRTSGLYYAPKGKKTSKDLVCLARFDVNQVYFGVKWQPKFKAPFKHAFAIKHPQIQAKNPKYIRYLCAESEIELNKWVTGIRLAKCGKALYDNYRGIIEEMAHEDIDRLASARNSLNSNTAASHQGQQVAQSESSQHLPRTLGSEANPGQMTTVIVHSSHQGGVQCTSSRSSTVSSKSQQEQQNSRASIPKELGFSCDSPEGGTIKKKPAPQPPQLPKSALATFKSSESGSNGQQQAAPAVPKGVRFKETYSMIPDNPYATLKRLDLPSNLPPPPATPSPPPPPPPLPNTVIEPPTERKVYKNINDILSNHKSALRQQDRVQPVTPMSRRASTDSIVSNPAMLHCGTIISDEPAEPVAQSPKVQLSPQPERPAPVLKPQVSRKPSLDRNIIQQKQQSIDNSRESSLERKPTYEDTLKKCQSLTRARSKQAATANVNGVDTESNGHPPLARHNSDPSETGSARPNGPVVPPKPTSLASRAMASAKLEPGNIKKISHLPPTGLGHSPRPSGQRSNSLNRPESQPHPNAGAGSAFLGDLENAMKKRAGNSNRNEESRPFPNRFSSGEYDNVESDSKLINNGAISPKINNVHVPPLPKRNEDTHLSWNRS